MNQKIYDNGLGVSVETQTHGKPGRNYVLFKSNNLADAGVPVCFHSGPIDQGFNGTTNEAVMEMLLHRLRIINTEFPCRENSLAITKLEESLMWLQARERKQQGATFPMVSQKTFWECASCEQKTVIFGTGVLTSCPYCVHESVRPVIEQLTAQG